MSEQNNCEHLKLHMHCMALRTTHFIVYIAAEKINNCSMWNIRIKNGY